MVDQPAAKEWGNANGCCLWGEIALMTVGAEKALGSRCGGEEKTGGGDCAHIFCKSSDALLTVSWRILHLRATVSARVSLLLPSTILQVGHRKGTPHLRISSTS